MNAFLSYCVEKAANADHSSALLTKLTLLLAAAWLLHAALARANPRWRVVLWRGSAVAIAIMLALALAGPTIPLALLPPIIETPAENTEQGSEPFMTTSEIPATSNSNLDTTPKLAQETPSASRLFDEMNLDRTDGQSGAAAVLEASSSVHQPLADRAIAAGSGWSMAAYFWTIWTIGLLVGALSEGVAVLRLISIRRRATSAEAAIIEQAAAIAAHMGCLQTFDVLVTAELASPCIVGPGVSGLVLLGMGRPAILLPGSCGLTTCDEDLSAVLAHEIQHLKNSDLPWNALLRGLARILWFHPLAWRVRIAHTAACDAVCDAAAASFLGNVAAYCRILARLALRVSAPLPAGGLAMARASTARRRIEALHRRLYSTGLSRAKVLLAVVVGLAAAGLLGGAALTHAKNGLDEIDATSKAQDKAPESATKKAAESPAELGVNGTVRDAAGQPIPGATVQVHSAGVRVGTSSYCPTCYVDCGKRVKTDKNGRYTIQSLDPTLVFRLLVVADGYRPEFLKKVDPQLPGDVDAQLTARPIPDDPARVVRGVVLGPDGKPLAGALVEPFGCQVNGRRWWGNMPGVDPLAITDRDGRFAIVCGAPVIGLDLRIEGTNAARRNFTLTPAGMNENKLELNAGSTVEGRIVRDGRGVPNVIVGLVQADRGPEAFVGNYQIGTDADGKFSLPNVPAGEEFTVYGLMDSFRAVGAVVSKPFKSAEKAITNVGDLPVLAGHRLQGRLVLADGKPVPPHTRVTIGRPQAWDSTFVEPDAAGRFLATGIPGERVSIHLSIPGYHLSAKNKSYEPLNGTSLEGVVKNDVDDLVVLYEPGEGQRPDLSDNAKWQLLAAKNSRLKTQPLAGVTEKLEAPDPDELPSKVTSTSTTYTEQKYPALPKIEIPPAKPEPKEVDNGPTKTVRGIVRNANGEPVANAFICMPVRGLGPFKVLSVTAQSDASGQFQLTVPEAWLAPPSEIYQRQPYAWAYVAGHAIGASSAIDPLFGDKPDEPCVITLPPESDISFVVLQADESPAVGAKVAPEHFRTKQGFDLVPKELVERITATTDAEGRVRMPALTRDGIHNAVVRFKGSGKQEFQIEMKSTAPAERELLLRATGRVEGRIVTDQLELTRGMWVRIESTDLTRQDNRPQPTGAEFAKVDDEGRFVIPEMATGRLSIQVSGDDRLPVRPRLPKADELVLLEGETLKLEFPLELCVRVHGVVRAKDTGRPIADAAVTVRYGEWRQGDMATTNQEGVYTTFALAGDAYAQVLKLPKGYVQAEAPWDGKVAIPKGVKEFELPVIELSPTHTITGTLLDVDGKPMANVKINGGVGNRRHGFGQTDEKGSFSLKDVPVGLQLEKFEIWTRDDHLNGNAISDDPFVVRVVPAKPNQ